MAHNGNGFHEKLPQTSGILEQLKTAALPENSNATPMPDTPCVVIDVSKMDRNIETMANIARQHRVKLRPHAKTHKMPWIAKKQLEHGAAGITVAKVSEAEVMAAHGVDDIFIAYPLVVDSKIEWALRLGEYIRLIVGVDSLEGARRLAGAAASRGRQLEVRLEVDTGLRRTGVAYDEALALARDIASLDALRLTGIYTFRGALMNGKATLDLRSAGIEEGRMMADLAERMRAAGIPIEDVSVGSTPTAAFAAMAEGVTEIRPGTYVFEDRMQAKFGVCSIEDCAAVVMATVVSRPTADLVVIDGGSKTFATDVQPNVEPLRLQGFGHILEAEGAVLERLSEEHGMIRVAPDCPLKVGDRIHIIPNHICSTINLHNKVYYVNDGSSGEESRSAGRKNAHNTFYKMKVWGRGMLE